VGLGVCVLTVSLPFLCLTKSNTTLVSPAGSELHPVSHGHPYSPFSCVTFLPRLSRILGQPLIVMPTSSGAHTRVSRADSGLPVTVQPTPVATGSARSEPPRPATTQTRSDIQIPIPSGDTEYEPRLIHPTTTLLPYPTLAEPGLPQMGDPAPIHDTILVPYSSADGPADGWISFTTALYHDVRVLQSEMAAAKAEEARARDEIDSFRATLADLEAMILREITTDDTPAGEKKKKKLKKTLQVDDSPNSQKSRGKTRSSPKGDSSTEDSSEEEEEAPIRTPRGERVPGLVEQTTRRPEFKALVSYRTYRLIDTTQSLDAVVTGKINGYLKKLKHHIDSKFSGDPAIQVVDFLRTFKEACDLNAIGEAAAVLILPYFLEGRAKAGLTSRLKHVTAPMPKFPAAVQWLLQSFATETVIAAAYQKGVYCKATPRGGRKSLRKQVESLCRRGWKCLY
jgi:hypothetical protein